MFDKLVSLGYVVTPFIENHTIAAKGEIEIFIDSEAKTYTARNVTHNSHDKISDDVLEYLRSVGYKATRVHNNMTGQS